MKFSILQENLKQSLSLVSHITGKNINLPILNNVLIEINDANIKLITTNLEMGITNVVRGKVDEAGSFTVDAKVLADFISLLPNKKVNIEKKDNHLIIEVDKNKTKMIGQGVEDFPALPVINKDLAYNINLNDFQKALSQVIFAVSNNESRIELSGVLFIFTKNTLTLAATDSYRLAERKIKAQNNDEQERRVIIPAKNVQEIMHIVSVLNSMEKIDGDNQANFYLSDNQILFTAGGSLELISRLIEGQYPDYKQIIPTKSNTEATVNRAELIRAVKISAIFSKNGVNDISLKFNKESNEIITASASGQVGENENKIEANITGDDNEIVLNYKYLLDGLNNIADEEVVVRVTDSNTPCIIKGKKDEDYLYIVMPIKQ